MLEKYINKINRAVFYPRSLLQAINQKMIIIDKNLHFYRGRCLQKPLVCRSYSKSYYYNTSIVREFPRTRQADSSKKNMSLCRKKTLHLEFCNTDLHLIIQGLDLVRSA
jgi:hypothetical protein